MEIKKSMSIEYIYRIGGICCSAVQLFYLYSIYAHHKKEHNISSTVFQFHPNAIKISELYWDFQKRIIRKKGK